MDTSLINFLTPEDRVRGFYELATHSHVRSLPGKVYHVSLDALKLLDDQQIGYQEVADDDHRSTAEMIS